MSHYDDEHGNPQAQTSHSLFSLLDIVIKRVPVTTSPATILKRRVALIPVGGSSGGGDGVGVTVIAGVGVNVGSDVDVGVGVGVSVGVGVGVSSGTGVGELVGLGDGVGPGISVGVGTGVVATRVGVRVGDNIPP